MLASAGFVKETDTWTTLPWNWLQWLLFIALLLILGMILLWLLRRIWYAINQPFPPYIVYQQPLQAQVVPPVVSAPAPAPQSVVTPIVEAPVSAPASTPASPISGGPTIINNYAGGVIVQMTNGSSQPAPGFTKKPTSFDINVKGKFDEEWS